MTLRQVLAGAVIGFGMMAGGCGGSSSEDAGSSASAGNRFATLDGMVAYYDEHHAKADTVDPRKLIERMHAETPLQEDLVAAVSDMTAVFELDVAIRERFGSELSPGGGMSSEPGSPLTMTTVEDARAEGTTVGANGEPETIHFVKIGDEWWISGYTLEYGFLEDISADELDAQVAQLKEMGRTMASVASDLKQRLEAGEFSSADEVRMAMAMGMMPTAPGG